MKFAMGEFWKTQNGYKAQIIRVERGDFPLRGVIYIDGIKTNHHSWTNEGFYCGHSAPSDLDLIEPWPVDMTNTPRAGEAPGSQDRAGPPTPRSTPEATSIGDAGSAVIEKLKESIADLHPEFVSPGYEPLASVLQKALDQAQAGKGKERHANGLPFLDQPIMEITRHQGAGFPMGQAQKKLIETTGLLRRGELDAAERELLGVIVYAAASILAIREMGE